MSNQKGTALVGAALTDETLASSHSILTTTPFGTGQKGLQQFFSPPEMAKLVKQLVGPSVNVLDLTAGDGSLLRSIDPLHSFGVEIDHDQVRAADHSYNAVKGDVQQVYTLLRLGMPAWDAIVLNPPFGLQWEDPTVRDGRATNSALMTYIYGSRLLSEQGQMIFICGKDRFYRQIAEHADAAGLYAVIECDDMFEGTTLTTAIGFAIHPGNRSAESTGYVTRNVPLDMLDMASTWVEDARNDALGRYNSLATRSYTYGATTLADQFKGVQVEYDRRTKKRLKLDRAYDMLLVGGKMIQWLPSAFALSALRLKDEARSLDGLNRQSVNYFVNDERVWNKILGFMDEGIITVEPKLLELVNGLLDDSRKETCPLYDIKPQQRLGFLFDVDFLRCTKGNTQHDLTEGEEYAVRYEFFSDESYRLDTRSQTIITTEERTVESKKNPGEYERKTFEKQAKVMRIMVGQWSFYDSGDESTPNIQFLIDHFDIPDPGQVGTKHPEEIAALVRLANEVLDDFEACSRVWEETHPEAMPFSRRDFQIQDIARLAFKGGGLLSWEQGLGKTLGGLLFAEMMVRLGAQNAKMVVAPGDLIPQWTREIERFHGVTPDILKSRPTFFWESDSTGKLVRKKTNGVHGQAVELSRKLANPKAEAFVLTYYEALTMVGMRGRNKELPPITVKEKIETRLAKGTGRYGYFFYDDEERHTDTFSEVPPTGPLENGEDPNDRDAVWRKQVPLKNYHDPAKTTYADGTTRASEYGYIHEVYEQHITKITSKEICPECHADTRNGWNGKFCEAEDASGAKCGYSHYAVKLRPAASYMSGAFKRGVVIVDEGTMIQSRNGNDSKRSIAMRGVRAKHKLLMTGTPIKNFIGQAFWLLWWCLGNGSKRFGYNYEGGHTKFENNFSVIEWTKDGGRRQNRKALPEVTNLSLLWRLLSSSVIRRRKEETGEKIVPKYYHEIRVPMGIAQAELTDTMLKNFPALFKEKYPDSNIVKAGMETIMAPMIGLYAKLDYASTLPEADPDKDWWGVEGVSNWTPACFRTVELAMALAKEGRKVLIGSNLVATSKWIAEALCEKGVDAIHILDEDGTTTDKDNRAKRVYAFQTDEHQVFCAGVKAIRLGHNLDRANAVILHGLDHDYETLDQFIARIHRLTSTQPVDVYVVIPQLDKQPTLTARKWQTLTMKGAAANLALDGRLIERNEDETDMNQIIRELVERGVTVTDECVDEVSVQEAWEALPMFEDYVAPEGLLPVRPELPEVEETEEAEGSLQMPQAEVTPISDAPAVELLPGMSNETAEFLIGGPLDENLAAEQAAAEEALEAELTAIENVYDPEAEVTTTAAVEKGTIKAVIQYDFPIGPGITPLPWSQVAAPDIEAWDAELDAELVPDEDPDFIPENPPAAEPTVDDVAVAMNATEMPEPDAMALILAQMEEIKKQIAAVTSKNAELEARLSTDEQLSLDFGMTVAA